MWERIEIVIQAIFSFSRHTNISSTGECIEIGRVQPSFLQPQTFPLQGNVLKFTV